MWCNGNIRDSGSRDSGFESRHPDNERSEVSGCSKASARFATGFERRSDVFVIKNHEPGSEVLGARSA